MITRMWRGTTRAADAETYARYIEETGIRAYGETPGNKGALLLTRPAGAGGDETEFLVVSFWESMDAVKKFAGPTPETAVFYPEDDRFLVDRDRTVAHYEVVSRLDAPDGT